MNYITALFRKYFLLNIYWILIAVLIALVVYFLTRKKLPKFKSISASFILSYAFFLLSLYVFSRHQTGYHTYELIPFWSYQWFLVYPKMLILAIINGLVFIPIGTFLPFITRSYRKTILVGILFSLVIQLLQLITTVGTFEFDDIFHNTLGLLAGCYICHKLRKYFLTRAYNKRREQLRQKKSQIKKAR